MTIYHDHRPDLQAFIADVQRLGFTVIQPQSPLHLQGVKSECIIITHEADRPSDHLSGDYSTFHLKLDFTKYDFYGSYLSNSDAPFAVTKPQMYDGRPYADVIIFGNGRFECKTDTVAYYEHTNY